MTPLHWFYGVRGLLLDALAAAVAIGIVVLPYAAVGLVCFFVGVLVSETPEPKRVERDDLVRDVSGGVYERMD